MTLSRRLAAEALGTAFLLAVVVGSGIAVAGLAGVQCAHIALLANSIATGCGLWVLITIFGPISGAHFNPAVTLAFASAEESARGDELSYLLTQWSLPYGAMSPPPIRCSRARLFTASEHVRAGPHQWWSEVVATAGLLLTIWLGARVRPQWVGGLVTAVLSPALLVHGVDVVRQSGRDAGARRHEYLHRHSTCRRPRIRRRSVDRCADCDRICALALSNAGSGAR